ncbi:MAG: hypothetical protein KBG28_05750 [Kofleriaceae bacterium]|nr:hypothetical protein [Kofleriaceae bacterium]MBP9203449.1 hypothetical protein [Kofleriaceae bacterium]
MSPRKPPPWTRPSPARAAGPRQKMTPDQVARARARAEAAGRRYPNLVDNMAILAEDKGAPDGPGRRPRST